MLNNRKDIIFAFTSHWIGVEPWGGHGVRNVEMWKQRKQKPLDQDQESPKINSFLTEIF